MRIIFTIDHYPPEQGGGATEVVRQLAERLVRRGHEVTVATKWSPCREPGLQDGVRVRGFRIHSPLNQAVLGVRGEVEEYLELIGSDQFDLIVNYAAQTWHANLALRNQTRIRAAKVFCTCGFSGMLGWRRWLYRRYFTRMPAWLSTYDAVVCHSARYLDHDACLRWGLGNTVVIPNGVEASEFRADIPDFRARHGLREKHLLLCVGDHFRNKGHGRVIQAFEGLGTEDVCLVIIGRDVGGWLSSCHRDCQARARTSRKRIIVLDGSDRAEVVSAYRSASVFLSGSHIEAFPLVILEAMAAGVPFVAFPAGNIRELSGGKVVESCAEMAARTDELLADPDLRARLGAEGRAMQVQHYEWEAVVSRYEALFRQIVRQRRRL